MPKPQLMPRVDLAKAAMVLNLLKDDQATSTYVTGCLLSGMSAVMLLEAGRPREEVIASTVNTIEAYEQAKAVFQSTTR